jgi:iron complex transport system permease protein
MQTLFRNPLAGPFVLGISSGASLGAALLIWGGGVLGGIWANFQFNDSALILASSTGSILVLLIVIFMSSKLRDVMALLIVGLMFGSITSALVTVMASFSSAEQLQQFIFWSYGSTGNLSWNQVGLLLLVFGISLLVILRLMKVLNVLLLGENYAQSLGVALRTSRILIISVTGLLAGSITAFVGPIAFVGLAVPHLTRIWFGNSDHRLLVPGVCLVGGILMLVCDSIAQWPFSDYILPINAVTSAVGAPIVIALLIRKNKIRL